ncbi:hypothetical protein E2562_012866 [Oryza meyeriana var. granulata]|uniref:Uncharacterized protein n=1 Tax=Oryza meyeriana var. granulata TaxID=110450 RepID=A0A6G1CPJ4_9ORYZ|nr:hypothetical protein E2562_012866 [Oryza meyeriana var. granulata]
MKPLAASPGRAEKHLPAPPGLAWLLLSKSQRGGRSHRASATSSMFVSRGQGAHVVGDHHVAQECVPPHALPLHVLEPLVSAHLQVSRRHTVANQGRPGSGDRHSLSGIPSPRKAQKVAAMEAQHEERQEEMAAVQEQDEAREEDDER